MTKVNPEKGTFLGLSFNKFEEHHYYGTFVVLLLYFLSAFIVYGYPKYKSALAKRKEITSKAGTITKSRPWWHIEWPRLKLDIKYNLWQFFHYYLPVLVAVIAAILGFIKIV